MAIYITGDCHGEYDRFSSKAFKEQKELTRNDFVIVCGDFGIWNNDAEERWRLKWLAEKNFTILFVDGNHEDFDRLYSDEFPVVDFHGGKAHQIKENVFHLMRGYVFELEGKKFFAFGGASSHDIWDGVLDEKDFNNKKEFHAKIKEMDKMMKVFRINHVSWWKEELPSEEEMQRGLKTLEENGNKVDFVISHCLPQNIAATFSRGLYEKDKLTEYFDMLDKKIEYSQWFCGHYHIEERLFCKYNILYDTIQKIV